MYARWRECDVHGGHLLMGLLQDLARAYQEGLAVQKYGPDWHQKLEQAQASTERTRAETAHIGAETRRAEQGIGLDKAKLEHEQLQNQQIRSLLDQEKAKLAELAKAGSVSPAAAEFILKQKEAEIVGRLNEAKIKETEAAAAQHRAEAGYYQRRPGEAGGAGGEFGKLNQTWGTGPDGEPAMLTKSGLIVGATGKIHGRLGEVPFSMAPTAQERNLQRYDVMIPVQLDSVQKALDSVKKLGWTGGVKAFIPGTEAYNQVQLYGRQLTAFGATIGQAMGDNRISDYDRKAYAKLYGVQSVLAGLPPGAKLGQELLDQAKQIIADVAKAHEQMRVPGSGLSRGPAMNEVRPEDLQFEENIQSGQNPVHPSDLAAPSASADPEVAERL